MTKITCTRRVEFDAAHRVMNHESKCRNLHGHRYVVLIEAEAPELDELGRVIDFSVLKQMVGGWIDTFWDHTTILNAKDTTLYMSILNADGCPNKSPYLMEENPTAENMAKHLLNYVCPMVLADTGVRVTKITVYETPNCSAVAEEKA